MASNRSLVETEAHASEIVYPMDSTRKIRLHWTHGTLGDVSYRLRFSHFVRHAWRPAVNVYRCETCISICLDLAGADHSDIELVIEGQRLSIRGERAVPEPGEKEWAAHQMIAMEIDYGPFEREVQLPDEVDLGKMRAEQQNGFLWIHLPLKKS